MPTKAKARSGEAKSGEAPSKRGAALQKPLRPSKELAAVVGSAPLPRGEMVSKVWDYIKKHNLQNPENRREILVDGRFTGEGQRAKRSGSGRPCQAL